MGKLTIKQLQTAIGIISNECPEGSEEYCTAWKDACKKIADSLRELPTDAPSPITGEKMVIVTEDNHEATYREKKFKTSRQYYKCLESKMEFTDSDMDSDFMWDVFRKYWEDKGFEFFYDIDGYLDKKEDKK